MNLQAEKIELAQKILSSNNKDFIGQVKEIVNSLDENDFWNELNMEQQNIIRKAQKQAAANQTIPHNEVMKKYKTTTSSH